MVGVRYFRRLFELLTQRLLFLLASCLRVARELFRRLRRVVVIQYLQGLSKLSVQFSYAFTGIFLNRVVLEHIYLNLRLTMKLLGNKIIKHISKICRNCMVVDKEKRDFQIIKRFVQGTTTRLTIDCFRTMGWYGKSFHFLCGLSAKLAAKKYN